MKSIQLKLTLNFSAEVPNTEDCIEWLLSNLDNALQQQINGTGIVPDNVDAYTTDYLFEVIEAEGGK